MSVSVVKVGGSLFDMPNLGERLDHWLANLPTDKVLLVPGGGVTADAIRKLDELHRFGEEASHWLALRALSLNARLLQRIVPHSCVISLKDSAPNWRIPYRLIVDMYAFAEADEDRPGKLPHTWDATSDSLALRVAEVIGADSLYLLKSISLPVDCDWRLAAEKGMVDAYFPKVIERISSDISVRLVDFRTTTH